MKSHASALAIVLLFLSIASAKAANDPTPKGGYLAKGYYIVVAAYRIGQEKYMESYVNKLNNTGLHTKYGYDFGRKYYYIYLDYYTDFDESIQKMLEARKAGGFSLAWVRIMKEDYAPAPVNEVKTDPVAEVKPDPAKEIPVKEETKTEGVVSNPVEIVVEEPRAETQFKTEVKKETPPLKEAMVLFYLYNPTSGEPIEGEVEIIDPDVSKLVKKVKAHEVVPMIDPRNKSGRVSLTGSSFGYRKVQHDFLLSEINADHLPEYMEWRDDHYAITFDLARLHKGDIETLYNVYFFNDAAIMLPESKYELQRLLDMMNSDTQYKIMLHGHTNGTARGKIITVGPSRNFFELTSDVVEGNGSAKELSYERALVIKNWLVANNISADRIDIKAWGGSRMIHDKNSNNARRNVRVEVEVLEN